MDFCNPRRKYTSLNGHLDTINYVPSSAFMKMYKKEQDGRKGKDNFLLRKSQSLTRKSSAVSKDKQEPWVQKYRPTKFTDLLSLDIPQCNILRFLTEWKDCISGSNGGDSNNENNKDFTDLPKILLISGSSGVGKTCIAHCATHAAGFHPVEINAGEGRTLESLKEVITSSLSNNHVIDKCPSLLIVDEIDSSADNASLISFIIKLVQRTKKATLRRPIIIICSDPYSPILKGIRKLCHLHQPLYPPTPSQISKYLNGIIQKEGHSKMLDQRHLMSLILSMDCDLRAILNAIQFHLLFSKTSSSSSTTTFLSLVKDDLKHNALHISRDVFKGSTKVCVKNLDSTLSERIFSNSLDLLPEYWGLMDGSRDCMSVGSGGLSGTKANSSLSSSLSSLQRMSSLYYLLSTATSTKSSILLIQKAFSTNAKSPKEFRIPNRDFILAKETERISSECPLPSTSSTSCKNDAFLERNSFLSRIVDHGIREMKVSNVQLLKEGSLEILKLKRIIELMLSERLSFILDPSSRSFKLSPFIEWTEFKFDNGFNEGLNFVDSDVDGDGDGAERISSNHINSVKQMVSSLLEKSRIDVSRSGELEKAYSGLTMRGDHQEIGAGGVDDDIITDKRRSYFFTDRSVKRARKDDNGSYIGGSSKENGTEKEKEKISFWFKYNEGFSNAVRRTIRMDDLFPKPQKNK